MDNIQLILYVVFLIGYFIFKALTGKKNVTGQDTRKFDQDDSNAPYGQPTEYEPYDPDAQRPKSFEEILEELTGGGRPKEESQERPVAHREIQQKDEERDWEFDLDEDPYHTPERGLYEESVKEASKFKTLDELVDLENIDINLGEVEELDAQEGANISNQYLSMFANLEDAKKAVVMSEILNRKY